MAIIDASVYVALVNDREQAHTAAWAWFEAAQNAGEELSAPAILATEVASALGRGLASPEPALEVVSQLLESELIELVTVGRFLATHAAKIAAKYRIRGCDALYVALADQRRQPLITLDRQQLERGSAVVEARRPDAG